MASLMYVMFTYKNSVFEQTSAMTPTSAYILK